MSREGDERATTLWIMANVLLSCLSAILIFYGEVWWALGILAAGTTFLLALRPG